MIKRNDNHIAPKKNNRGGKPGNKGGGRPRGARNKNPVDRAIKEKLLASGMSPLAFACKVINTDVGKKINNREVTWQDIQWAMSIAMPKLHPDAQPPKQDSLGTVQVLFDPQKFAELTPDEVRQCHEQLVRLQSGIEPNGLGDGQVTRLDPFSGPDSDSID